ncbi:MAG: hypothetical protein LBQ68_00985 [Clostridiales bacterium]|jgi:hypothetical protein|nr:hypothetical protein [Clostridiales bacterium]
MATPLSGRLATVNMSSTSIPVYNTTVSSGSHIGGLTAGGTQIGTIYQYEFFTQKPTATINASVRQIVFRNPNHVKTYGYIDPCTTNMTGNVVYTSWALNMAFFHNYRVNGSSLITFDSNHQVTLTNVSGSGSKIYNVFVCNKATQIYSDDGATLVATVPVNGRICTIESTVGETNDTRLRIHAYRNTSTANWARPSTTTGGFWADLQMTGSSGGTMPTNRNLV